MVIDSAGQVALLSYLNAKKNQDTVNRSGSGTGRADSVEFSAQAMAQVVGTQQAIALPQLLVGEDVVRWNMARIFMDTLFGDSGKDSQKAEEGLVEAVVGEASFDALLEEASREEGSGRATLTQP